MVRFMGPVEEVQGLWVAAGGHLIVYKPGTSSPLLETLVGPACSWGWILSTPEVLCRSLPFLTLMWLGLVSTMCSGSVFTGVRGPLGLACV